MSDDLDLRAIHRRHEPDPRFVAALGDRLEAIMANPASADVSADEATARTIELEPGDSQRPPARHRSRRVFSAAVVLAAASVAVFALVVSRDRSSREDPDVYQGGPQPNGWVAFSQQDGSADADVYLVREGEPPRRVAGSDVDTSFQVCPAFSPDGGRLVYGQATGWYGSGYEDDAELVIVDVGADGSTSGTTTITVDDLSAPPCPLWSPDGRWLAFGAESGVLLVDTITEETRLLSGYHPNDVEWRPGTDELAITGNRPVDEVDDAPIDIYTVSTGEVRQLGSVRAANLTWSPDGSTLAYQGGENDTDELWLVDADGTDRRLLTHVGSANHGIGPVWSPTGERIAYQRLCCGRAETHEVVLVTAIADDPDNPIGTETVISPPTTPGTDGPVPWYPFSVTWSPDGSMLLYNAWNTVCNDLSSADCGRLGPDGLLAVPVDTSKAPVFLAERQPWLGADNNFGFSQPWVPMQNWGRQPPG